MRWTPLSGTARPAKKSSTSFRVTLQRTRRRRADAQMNRCTGSLRPNLSSASSDLNTYRVQQGNLVKRAGIRDCRCRDFTLTVSVFLVLKCRGA
eukprot:3353759-Pleurochrysis_carterae.AAC.1